MTVAFIILFIIGSVLINVFFDPSDLEDFLQNEFGLMALLVVFFIIIGIMRAASSGGS